jgi:hypothetical protein
MATLRWLLLSLTGCPERVDDDPELIANMLGAREGVWRAGTAAPA